MKFILIMIAVVIVLIGLIFKMKKQNEIVVYGTLMQFSSSGSMKFYYYDIENKKSINDQSLPWFWGTVDDSQIKYVDDNQKAVFKITGKKLKDDCGYTEGICFEDISITEIKAIK